MERFNADNPAALVLDLDPPIRHKAKSYARIEFREPTAADLRRILKSGRGGSPHEDGVRIVFTLLPSLSDVPAAVIDMLPVSKFNIAVAWLSYHLGANK